MTGSLQSVLTEQCNPKVSTAEVCLHEGVSEFQNTSW